MNIQLVPQGQPDQLIANDRLHYCCLWRTKFKDRKFVERALNSVHAKYRITILITGNRAGVEEMALWWAAQKPLPTVIVIPHTGWTPLDVKDRYERIFTQHGVSGVIVFGRSAFFGWLDDFANKHGVK